MTRVTVRGDTGEDWRRVILALGEVDRRLPAQFRKAMRTAVRPAVQEAKGKVRSLPVRGRYGSTGLRRKVARGVRAVAFEGNSRRTASLTVLTSMPRENEAAIPRGLDSPRGWRHPVFGHRDRWVQQHPMRTGWFTDTLMETKEPVQRRLHELLEEARDEIARAGDH